MNYYAFVLSILEVSGLMHRTPLHALRSFQTCVLLLTFKDYVFAISFLAILTEKIHKKKQVDGSTTYININ